MSVSRIHLTTAPVARFAGAAAVAAAALMALAGPASAHVTVNPRSVTTGGFAELSFRVPTESASASTTQLEVTFPTETPLAHVSTKPIPGWTATVEKAKLATPIKTDDGEITEAVSKITWTGGAIAPGQYQNFDVSAGAFPDKPGELVFKAVQTYSDGSVVRWIDVVAPGGAEAEHPAPVLEVKAAAPEQGAPTATTPGTTPAAADASDADGLARGLGAAGLLAGLIALGLVLARKRTPSDAPPARDAAQV
jgi:uncharacterized protein YcnI